MFDAFDVFLCHNSRDKTVVRELADALEQRGLRSWLDERVQIPGRFWQLEVEAALETVRAVAVLVGPDGQGPWQQAELQAALLLGAERGLAVIPVLLPGVPFEVQLPLFLRNRTWVDFRSGFDANGLDRLAAGIRDQRTPDGHVAAEPQSRFLQKHRQTLERWSLMLGAFVLALGIPFAFLDLPGKREAFLDTRKVEPAQQLVRGELLDAATLKPLAKVKVWLPELGLEGTTNALGLFELEVPLAKDELVKLRTELEGYRGLDKDPPVGTFNTWLMRRAE
jgi:hypothetical protein